MSRLIKKVIFVFSFLFLLFNIKANALVTQTDDYYVNDYANVLSAETKKFIMDHSISLDNKTRAQIIVVTIKNLEGRTLEDYAVELFRSFGIGDDIKNNGLLLLFSLEDRAFRVEVGDGLEEILPDGLTGRYQDEYMIPYFKEDKFDEGIKNGYSAFYKRICEYYKIDSSDIVLENTNVFIEMMLWFFFFYCCFCSIIYAFSLGKTIENKSRFYKIFLTVLLVINIVGAIFLYQYHPDDVMIVLRAEVLFTFMIYLTRNVKRVTYSRTSSYGRHGRSYSSGGRSRSSSSRSYSGHGGRSSGGGSSRRF